VIGCSGNVRGAVMMTMSMETACMAVESFVGEEVAPGSADLTDGLGELLNIIAGAGAANLAELNVRISLPTVLIGKDQIVASKQSTPWVVIPMLLDDGHEFCLEVTMEEDAS
jgi:chemotaxis protein CheX